jgi:L-threonylcarbamoyladenylate synthase
LATLPRVDNADRSGAQVMPAHTPELFERACQAAAGLLAKGELVGLPTETVYGLAANAFDALAVGRIYEAKGRPRHNPIIVHVASMELARRCAAEWPEEAETLARAFWPGPLTLVLPRSKLIPDIVTAGGNTVGIRWPSHPIIQSVIQRCGFPLAAPSANPANMISPTTAEHVAQTMGDRIAMIVDGGACQVGIESTVLDLTTRPAVILRPGMITLSQLQAVVPVVAERPPVAGALKSPGQLPKHYSPRAKLLLFHWSNEQELRLRIESAGFSPRECHVIAFEHIPQGHGLGRVSVVPHDPEAYARALYAELHRCDQELARLIVVEEPPFGAAWQGIRDRLRRAAA